MSYDARPEDRLPAPVDLRAALRQTAQTAVYPAAGVGRWDALLYVGCGLAGEAGETANQLKKVARDDGGHLTTARRERIKKELGGTFWYWLRVCAETGLDPYEVITAVFAELDQRQQNGTLRGDDGEGGRVAAVPQVATTQQIEPGSYMYDNPSFAYPLIMARRDAGAMLVTLTCKAPRCAQWDRTVDMEYVTEPGEVDRAVYDAAHQHALEAHTRGVSGK